MAPLTTMIYQDEGPSYIYQPAHLHSKCPNRPAKPTMLEGLCAPHLAGQLLNANFLEALELAAPGLQGQPRFLPCMLLCQLLWKLVGLQWLKLTSYIFQQSCH